MRPMGRWGLGLGFVLACGDDSASTTVSAGGQGGLTGSGGAESATGGGGGLGSGGLGGGEVDLDLYDPNRVIEIAIELEDSDFAALRAETRSLLGALVGEGCLEEPFASPYSFYSATVTVEGEVRANVGVRKKGFVGSLSAERPSLKIDFGEFESEQRLGEYERLTLNNSNQDPSRMRTCLTYGVFTSLGLPAPRCNFAHVVVNGEDLGLYANVEPINRDFVRRVFPDDSGTLYEGTLSDFSADWRGTFEKETHLESVETPLIDALTLALEAPDGELLASLEPTLDLEAFYLYWAAEVLTNHWDGYANNANNFYLYDTGIGDLSFIVSGPDGALQEGNPFPAGPAAPRSVFATSRLARRLYLLPESRDAFRARLAEVLGQWDSSSVLSEIDRLESLLAPYGAAPAPSDVDEVRQFIAGREAALAAELGGAPPPWPYPEREPPCFSPLGTLTGSFVSEYGTLQDNPVATGEGELEVTLGGAALALDPGGAVVGPDGPNRATMYVTGLRQDGDVELLVLRLDRPVLSGQPVLLDVFGNVGVLGVFHVGSQAFEPTGYLDGSVEFSQFSEATGAPVLGSIAGNVVVGGF